MHCQSEFTYFFLCHASPFQDDSANVVLTGGHREEGLLPAEAEKSFHQLLFLSSGVAQMESLSQGFEFRGRQEIQSLRQLLQVALFGSHNQHRTRENQSVFLFEITFFSQHTIFLSYPIIKIYLYYNTICANRNVR